MKGQAGDAPIVPKAEDVSRLPTTRMLRLHWLRQLMDAFVDAVEPTIARFTGQKRLVAMEIDNEEFAFYKSAGARTRFMGNYSALDAAARRLLQAGKPGEIELRLLPGQLVKATITVPAAGLDFVEQIIGSRLDRLTPWTPEKILFGFAVAQKPGPDGQFGVDIIATSREIAARSIARLDAFGLKPSRVGSSAEALGERLRIDLFRGQNDYRRRSLRRRIATFAIGVLSLAFLAYCLSAYLAWRSDQDAVDLDHQLAAARRMLVAGTADMQDRDKDLALIHGKTPQTARFALLDRLAAIIPDNTYLDELDIQPGSLRIAGTSTEASALIEILQSEKTVSDAKFTAPVTRQDDGRDRFDVTAVLKQPPGEVRP